MSSATSQTETVSRVPGMRHPHAEQRVVLTGVSLNTYEALLAEMDNPGVRLTYDRGSLEIVEVGRLG